MEYKMIVTIFDPETPEGMCSDITYELNCSFSCNDNDYGNGHHVAITSADGRFQNYYDLRYDTDFHKNKKEAWLADWAYSYWTGENGSYKVKSLTIKSK